MKKIKIIDLLNKIANGEPIPYRIKYNENIYYYDLDLEWYIREDLKNELFIDRHYLRDNIEIIEEPQPTEEEINMYTNKFLEVWTPIQQQFGKLFDELIRIKNDLGLNLEDNIKEEPQEHKIPEKIKIPEIDDIKNSRICYIEYKINEILDYLEEIE